MKENQVQELLEAGITDLGGVGSLLLEIEYENNKGEAKEAVYHLPETCNEQDIIEAGIRHIGEKSILVLQFNQHDVFTIFLPDRCVGLTEVRLPEAVGGDDITNLFST